MKIDLYSMHVFEFPPYATDEQMADILRIVDEQVAQSDRMMTNPIGAVLSCFGF